MPTGFKVTPDQMTYIEEHKDLQYLGGIAVKLGLNRATIVNCIRKLEKGPNTGSP